MTLRGPLFFLEAQLYYILKNVLFVNNSHSNVITTDTCVIDAFILALELQSMQMMLSLSYFML